MEKKVSIDLVLKLNTLFREKNWFSIENHDFVFESICNMSEILSKEENNLILELIERYNWVTYNDYNVKLKKILQQIVSICDNKISKIYFFPIIKPEDEDKNKSGNSISYMLKCLKPSIKEASKISIVELTKFESINSAKLTLKADELVILVDDYVGSGETLQATLTEIRKNKSINNNNLIIASIAIQKDTITELLKQKLTIIYDEAVIKGISQYYDSPIKEKNIQTMLEIEKKLISGRNFSLGYEESEAIVTMLRTPDNTFPVFWHNYKKSTNLNPPFPRE